MGEGRVVLVTWACIQHSLIYLFLSDFWLTLCPFILSQKRSQDDNKNSQFHPVLKKDPKINLIQFTSRFGLTKVKETVLFFLPITYYV